METHLQSAEKLRHIPDSVLHVIALLKARLCAWYGHRLSSLILYGSYARGDYSQDSDVDLLVVLNDDKLSRVEEIDKLVKLKYDLMIDNHILISTKAITAKDFENKPNAIFHFIRKEGIEV